jgi:hypothetical protein
MTTRPLFFAAMFFAGCCAALVTSSLPLAAARAAASPLPPPPAASSSFVFLADLHVGEGCNSSAANYEQNDTDCYSVQDLRATVAKINMVVGNASLVLVGGDLTATAQRTEFLAARHWLGALRSPYLATIGNHDVWSYDHVTGDRTPTPQGDLLFADLFQDVFADAGRALGSLTYPNTTATASFHGQSWEFRPSLERFGHGLHSLRFLAPDFNTREKAIPPYDGVLGMAALNNFSGGSWPWFLEAIHNNAQAHGAHANAAVDDANADMVQATFLLTHQPFRCRFGVPDWYFCFAKRMKAAFRGAVESAPPALMDSLFLGAQLSGHQHRWFDGAAFDEDHWENFTQFETSAVKGDVFDKKMSSSFMVFHISDAEPTLGHTVRIDRYWREDGQWRQNATTAISYPM